MTLSRTKASSVRRRAPSQLALPSSSTSSVAKEEKWELWWRDAQQEQCVEVGHSSEKWNFPSSPVEGRRAHHADTQTYSFRDESVLNKSEKDESVTSSCSVWSRGCPESAEDPSWKWKLGKVGRTGVKPLAVPSTSWSSKCVCTGKTQKSSKEGLPYPSSLVGWGWCRDGRPIFGRAYPRVCVLGESMFLSRP